MNLQKIKELCEKKNYKLNQLAADINMSERTYTDASVTIISKHRISKKLQ